MPVSPRRICPLKAGWDDQALREETVPAIMRPLRVGRALVPYFACFEMAVIDFFNSVMVERHAHATYSNTEYAPGPGAAHIQCFQETSLGA